jgi:Ca2+-binding RTX toxin-like protein
LPGLGYALFAAHETASAEFMSLICAKVNHGAVFLGNTTMATIGGPTNATSNANSVMLGESRFQSGGIIDNDSDTLTGLGGNDILVGDLWGGITPGSNTESDDLYGGAGDDVLYGDFAPAITGVAYSGAFDAQNQGGSGDRLFGGLGKDTLYGGGGSNTYYGGDGQSSTDEGATDNDTMYGGGDGESFYGEGGSDLVFGAGGNDNIWGGVGADTLNGGDGNDYIYGYEINRQDDTKDLKDIIHGNEGDDSIFGGKGGDVLHGDNGNDEIYGAGFSNYGDNAKNLIFGDAGDDTLWASEFGDMLDGGTGDDKLHGSKGRDTLIGGKGADKMDGREGNDTYFVDSSGDTVTEGSSAWGLDSVFSTIGFTLGSNVENLTLTGLANLKGTGNELNNIIDGNVGRNLLSGLAGNDKLSGDLGNDILRGGLGADRFIFDTKLNATKNRDTIVDFNVVDTIVLENAVFKGLKGGVLKDAQFKMIGVAGAVVDDTDRIIYNKATGTVTFDDNGSDAGGHATVFATLSNKVALTHLDFFIS